MGAASTKTSFFCSDYQDETTLSIEFPLQQIPPTGPRCDIQAAEQPVADEALSSMSMTPTGALNLAQRRQFEGTKGKGISIDVKKEKAVERRKIQFVNRFADFYEAKEEVMPSCHRGMKIIYARRRSDNGDVVVKVRVKGESFRDKDEEAEWRETTEFMLNLPKTQGIARVYEVLEDTQGYYVVMEKVPGKDLFETIVGKGLMPISDVKDVMKQLLKALGELHSQGCIHKDLKLENVMFDKSPPTNQKVNWNKVNEHSPIQVKIIDFDTIENIAEKRAKDVLGSNQYIAQEAYDGLYSPSSDIFAVGVIGYRLLTNRFPFKSSIFDDRAGENWVGSPKMQEIRQKLCRYEISWSQDVFLRDKMAKDFLSAMLSSDCRKRPTAQEALAHPWLSQVPRRMSVI